MSGKIENRTSLGALVAERPARIRLFEHLRLDYCCGGSRSLADACRRRGLDPDTVRELVEAMDREGRAGADPGRAAEAGPGEERDWRQASLAELCDHIVAVHHDGLRGELPHLAELLATVVRVHGEGRPELELTERAFAKLRAELEHHIAEEEETLFPALRALEREGDAAGVDLGAVERHVAEHEGVGRSLVALRELAGGYDPAAALCSTHRSLLEGLARFEADLHRHVHEENNVLFPRARQLAAATGLLDVLLDALTRLGEAGHAEEACRLAATAYAGLRRRDAAQAQRLNVLMHRLTLSPRNRAKEAPCPPPTPISTSAASRPPAATS